jgi:hypothetical protein
MIQILRLERNRGFERELLTHMIRKPGQIGINAARILQVSALRRRSAGMVRRQLITIYIFDRIVHQNAAFNSG